MSAATLSRLVRQVRRRVDPAGGAADGELLARWLDRADQSAFELLLWRHGPMVWATCRRVLRHDHDAEDAFQAAFLTLARKAASISKVPSLGGWLYRVAHRAALAARARPQPQTRDDLDDIAVVRADEDLHRHLDEEIARLPERYREPFVLCYLQGLSTDEAAEALRIPRGTVGTRVAWARRKLRERLERHDRCLPAVLPQAAPPPALLESALAAVTENVTTPAVAELCQEIMTMFCISRMKCLALLFAPVLLLAVGVGGLTLTPAHAEKPKPTEDKKKPDDKPKAKPDGEKKPDADKKGVDIQGVIKSISKDGKTLTVVTATKNKKEEEQTVELKLTDKTAVTFSAVGPDEAKAKEGYHVMAWLAEGSKDTAAKVVYQGDKHTKGEKPSFSATVAGVADDGKSFTVTVRGKKNEPDTTKTFKLTDKTVQTYHYVGVGGAKLAKDANVSVWLAEGSPETVARLIVSGKPDLPSKKGGPAPAHYGEVSAVAKDGKSFTIAEGGKKGDEPKKTDIKLGENSKVYFANVGAGGAAIKEKQSVTVWVDDKAKDTAAIAIFHADTGKQGGLSGKVVEVAKDGKSFTLQTPPTKKNEAGAEVKIALGEKSQVVFDNVEAGGAKITKDYLARVTLAEGSKDTAALAVFGRGK